ncbi:endonuclease or glycosyl hydrolase [Artemisia annua]|uniref:Endonuclease or glycosyl hydrolase n=1 Tax=Artemisia annua TaxID=35608 RepID=A0A2U1N970_ARTAN|nr:endonuclease or glycosyl hydrolase [Artemisia annua]
MSRRKIRDEIVIKLEDRKKTMHSKNCLPRSDVDDCWINLRLVELEELLGTYCYGIPVSCLSWLERVYLKKFNKSLDCKSLGVNNIKVVVEKMRYKGMVLLFEEPESKKVHVMSARMVQVRRNVSLKPNVQKLLDMNSGVIEFTSFEDLYERQFKVKLNYFQYGLTNLNHLCKVLKDILMVEEAGAKVIKAKKRKYTNMSMLSSPQQNQNICDEIDFLIDQRLVELEELLGTYCYGIPISCLSWLLIVYLQKFNKSLDCKSLGVNNIKELVEKMHDKGMVVLFEEPESKKFHVMSARVLQVRQNVSLKPNVQTLLDMNSGVIEFTSFEDLYERQFKVKLNYIQYGLTNLDHLCKVLKDILMVEEADPTGAKVIKAKKRKYTNMSMLSSPQQNRNICDEIDFLIDQRLIELEELLGNYCYGIPWSCLSWLERVYPPKFNKSLDCKSLGVNNIKELVEKMRDKGMVLLFEEPESKKFHVMSARMVQVRRNVSLKPNVQELLDMNSGVIEFTSFEDLYERQFKVKLNYFQYGLTNLNHLCKVLKDILMVEEADPTGAKLMKGKKWNYTNMSMLSSLKKQNQIDVLIDQRLVELEELLGTYYDGFPMSCLSNLSSGYMQKFNKSLELKSLGVTGIKELVEKMLCKGMVVLVKGSEGEHVMSARMVEIRQNVFLKHNVQRLLRRHSGEIKFESFKDLYEEQFKVELKYLWYGLTDLDDLCKVLKDILVVEEANPSRVKVIKAVKNATIQGKGRMPCAPQLVRFKFINLILIVVAYHI